MVTSCYELLCVESGLLWVTMMSCYELLCDVFAVVMCCLALLCVVKRDAES